MSTKRWQIVFEQLMPKYGIDYTVSFDALPYILSDGDLHRLSQAMKYPNGKLRLVE